MPVDFLWTLLKEARKHFPPLKYAIGVFGVVLVAALCLRLLPWVDAVSGFIGIVGGMVCLKILFQQRPSKLPIEQRVVLWVGVLVFIALAVKFVLTIYSPSSQQLQDDTPKIVVDGPTHPSLFPNADEIADLPEKEEVMKPPKVPAKEVTFAYRNATGIPMKLILFDCYYHYFPSTSNPLAPKSPCRPWDFPPSDSFIEFKQFSKSTGWYVFFVVRNDTGQRCQLGTKNIFYSNRPTLTVTSTGNVKEPFKAVFGSSL